MNYSLVKYNDIANGIGLRTTMFVSGCRNHCPGCFQPETWAFDHGSEYTKDVMEEILHSLESRYNAGLTLLGGDPFEEENQAGLIETLRLTKSRFPEKTIWAFTGYLLEDLLPGGKKHTEYTDEMLSHIDVLVDGPFIQAKKDLLLKFRGSSNQRLIDMKEYRRTGEIVTIMGS